MKLAMTGLYCLVCGSQDTLLGDKDSIHPTKGYYCYCVKCKCKVRLLGPGPMSNKDIRNVIYHANQLNRNSDAGSDELNGHDIIEDEIKGSP